MLHAWIGMLLTLILLAAVLSLAYANGANDVSKGVATLVGSRVATYKQGLTWGSVWTLAGGLAAVAISAGLMVTFSTRLVTEGVSRAPVFPLAVAVGAFGWVLFASRVGLPVSTTHSLAGGIVGAGLATAGTSGVRWDLLATAVFLPLAVSPFLSCILAYTFHFAAARTLAGASSYCVCLGQPQGLRILPAGTIVVERQAPAVVVGHQAACEEQGAPRMLPLGDALHWTASATLSFARGLNDTPKIVALASLAPLVTSSAFLFVGGALAMTVGSYVYGRRVTHTLGERVTSIDPVEGVASVTVASVLVLLASTFALPVSTTHVASGAIIGVGLRDGARAVDWRTVRAMVAAWVITLPVAALLAAVSVLMLR